MHRACRGSSDIVSHLPPCNNYHFYAPLPGPFSVSARIRRSFIGGVVVVGQTGWTP